jgi:molybdate transport system regulatory protein
VSQKIAKTPRQGASTATAAVQQPRLRVLFGEIIAIGPGKIRLLELIEESGSISGAARHMNMSYRRAWLLVETMNRSFRAPLVETAQGGKGGGGAQVTELGKDVLRRYRQMEKTAAEAVAGQMEDLKALMADHPPEAIS